MILCDAASAAEKMHRQKDYSHDQQDVYQAACDVKRRKSQEPHNDKHGCHNS